MNDNNKRKLCNKWVIFADYDFPLMQRFVNVHMIAPYDSFCNSSKIWQIKNEMSHIILIYLKLFTTQIDFYIISAMLILFPFYFCFR